jgi:uncharacterized membrane protein
MEMREFSGDLVLCLVLIISSLILIHRLWSDLLAVLGVVFMMGSLSGLLLIIHRKIMLLERSLAVYQRTTRANLEEISTKMVQKYDGTIAHVDGVMEEFTKRIYR